MSDLQLGLRGAWELQELQEQPAAQRSCSAHSEGHGLTALREIICLIGGTVYVSQSSPSNSTESQSEEGDQRQSRGKTPVFSVTQAFSMSVTWERFKVAGGR